MKNSKVFCQFVFVAASAAITSCSFSKPTSTSINALGIPGESAWATTETHPISGVRLMTRTLPDEALPTQLRKPVPLQVKRVEIPSARPYEVVKLGGIAELEGTAFVVPRLYVSTLSNYGAVMTYGVEQERTVLSLPVALLNGMDSKIPTISGSIAQVPANFTMNSADETKRALNTPLETLPVCPTSFTLRYRGRTYTAENPMRGSSLCPINQFFRVEFEGPKAEIKELLEAGAAVDESVVLTAELQYAMELPRRAFELRLDGGLLLNRLRSKHSVPILSARRAHDALVSAVLDIARESGIQAWYSPSLASAIPSLFGALFEVGNAACGSSPNCYTLQDDASKVPAVELSWRDNVQVSQTIQFPANVALGPSSSVTAFEINPSMETFSMAEIPVSLRGLSRDAVSGVCLSLQTDAKSGEIDLLRYCNALAQVKKAESRDGYSNLGSNTQVFPGAWIRLEVKDMEEFTSAKFQAVPGGRTEVLPEILPLGGSIANEVKCLEGAPLACEEYQMRDEPVRTASGDLLFSSLSCREGEPGCACESSPELPKTKECRKQVLQYRPVREQFCEDKEKFEFCPYYRLQKEKVASDLEYDCQTVMTKKEVPFLCIGGCVEHYELSCKVKKDTAVVQERQVPNCIGFDPEKRSAIPAEVTCANPQYKCRKWSQSCKRYSVNQALHIVYEEAYQRWRPLNIQTGEYPESFLDSLEVKFEGPRKSVSGCSLAKFERKVRGNVFFFKIPEKGKGVEECGQPLWDDLNTGEFTLPTLKIQSRLKNIAERGCGRSEVIVSADELPMTLESSLIPTAYAYKQTVRIGPINSFCRHPGAYQVGDAMLFIESAPVRVRGTLSVLGDVLESKGFGGSI